MQSYTVVHTPTRLTGCTHDYEASCHGGSLLRASSCGGSQALAAPPPRPVPGPAAHPPRYHPEAHQHPWPASH
eukprot:36028-Eustigmatos_ZCMA.PRE.1